MFKIFLCKNTQSFGLNNIFAEKLLKNMDKSPNITGTTYQHLKQQCEAVGISLTQLCREAGVERSTVERWKHRDPKSIEMLKEFNAIIEAKRKQINTHE